MANISIKIGRSGEVPAEDVIKWARQMQHEGPTLTVLAALAVLAAGIEKVAVDVAADVNNPLALLLNGAVQIEDFLALWPEVRAFLRALGVVNF